MDYYGKDPYDQHKCDKCGWLCRENDGSKVCALEIEGFIPEAIMDVNNCEQWKNQYIYTIKSRRK